MGKGGILWYQSGGRLLQGWRGKPFSDEKPR